MRLLIHLDRKLEQIISLYLVLMSSIFLPQAVAADGSSRQDVRIVKAGIEYKLEQAESFLDLGRYQHVQRLLEPMVYPEGNATDLNSSIAYGSLIPNDWKQRIVKTLLSSYWEQGNDEALLHLASNLENRDEEKVWNCRVFERNLEAERASSCWNSIGEIERSKRASRIGGLLSLMKKVD